MAQETPQTAQDGQKVPRVNDETDFGAILGRLWGGLWGSLGGPWAFLGHHVAVLGPSWAAKNIKHGMGKTHRKIQYKMTIFASPRDAWNHPGGVLRRPKRATLGNLCPPTGMS